MGVCAERDTKGTGEAEVSELEVAFFVDQEVLGLEIAVENTVRVAIAGAVKELRGEFLDLW